MNDEIEHAHAAWLLAQGLRPYVDFFEQHTPAIWQALSVFYRIRPDAGPEILYWGRALGLVSLIISSGLTGFLALDATGSRKAALVSSIVWTSLACVTDGVSIRPELLGLPLTLWALRAGTVAAKGGRTRPLDAALAAASASLACYCAPRAALSAAALALGWAVLARPSAKAMVWAAGGAASGLLFVWAFLGRTGLRWVVGFAGHISPPFSVFSYWNAYPGGWVILMGLGGAALAGGVSARRPAKLLAWVLLVSAAGPLLDRRPFAQTFAFMLPPAIVLAVSALSTPWSRWGRLRLPAAGAALALWLVPCARAHWLGWSQARMDGSNLEIQVAKRSDLCRKLAGETVILRNDAHPIGARDASYYWHGLHFLAAGTLEAAGLDSPRPDFYDDVADRRPAIVDGEFARLMREMDGTGRLEGLLRKDYDLLRNVRDGGGESGVYWVRKDFVPKLASPQPR